MAIDQNWIDDIPIPDFIKWAMGLQDTTSSSGAASAYEPSLQSVPEQATVITGRVADALGPTYGVMYPLVTSINAPTEKEKKSLQQEAALNALIALATAGALKGGSTLLGKLGKNLVTKGGRRLTSIGVRETVEDVPRIFPKTVEKNKIFDFVTGKPIDKPIVEIIPEHFYPSGPYGSLQEISVDSALEALQQIANQAPKGVIRVPDRQVVNVVRVPTDSIIDNISEVIPNAQRTNWIQEVIDSKSIPWETMTEIVPGRIKNGVRGNPRIIERVMMSEYRPELLDMVRRALAQNEMDNLAPLGLINRGKIATKVSEKMLDYPLSESGRAIILGLLAKKAMEEQRTPNPRVR